MKINRILDLFNFLKSIFIYAYVYVFILFLLQLIRMENYCYYVRVMIFKDEVTII